MTGQMLEKIEAILLKEKPDWLLVYGDTNSTLAGALAAVKLHIPVAHVEAGLRSFNRNMPEEINRILTDHCANYLFAPTETAVSNLVKDGIAKNKVFLSGDVMYDAALYYAEKAELNINRLASLGVESKQYFLVTLHRAENTDDRVRLSLIIEELISIAEKMMVIFPLHPRTKNALKASGLLKTVKEKLKVVEPLGYLDMVLLEKHATIIITDSGGVQKEAYFHQVPCITLRDETEWIELLQGGFNTLYKPSNPAEKLEHIVQQSYLHNKDWTQRLYGNGMAAEKIVNNLV
jgi:UDP-GlcNAc3NAcA epimerase